MPGFFNIETHPGQPVILRDTRLIPFTQCVLLRLPVINLRFMWCRPASVLVTRAGGHEQVMPVQDPTRQIVWALYLAIAMMTVLSLWSRSKLRGRT